MILSLVEVERLYCNCEYKQPEVNTTRDVAPYINQLQKGRHSERLGFSSNPCRTHRALDGLDCKGLNRSVMI